MSPHTPSCCRTLVVFLALLTLIPTLALAAPTSRATKSQTSNSPSRSTLNTQHSTLSPASQHLAVADKAISALAYRSRQDASGLVGAYISSVMRLQSGGETNVELLIQSTLKSYITHSRALSDAAPSVSLSLYNLLTSSIDSDAKLRAALSAHDATARLTHAQIPLVLAKSPDGTVIVKPGSQTLAARHLACNFTDTHASLSAKRLALWQRTSSSLTSALSKLHITTTKVDTSTVDSRSNN